MRPGFRSALRWAAAAAGGLLAADRVWEASRCYRQLQDALALGDPSGADGWRTFLTVDLVEAGAALGLGLGLAWILRPRRTAP